MKTYHIMTRDENGIDNDNCGDYETLAEAIEQAIYMADNETWNECGQDIIVETDTESGTIREIFIDIELKRQ